MTAPLAALLAAAWTLIFLLGLVSIHGIWRMDRKRAEGVDRATAVSQGEGRRRDCRSATSAGRRSETSATPRCESEPAAQHP